MLFLGKKYLDANSENIKDLLIDYATADIEPLFELAEKCYN